MVEVAEADKAVQVEQAMHLEPAVAEVHGRLLELHREEQERQAT